MCRCRLFTTSERDGGNRECGRMSAAGARVRFSRKLIGIGRCHAKTPRKISRKGAKTPRLWTRGLLVPVSTPLGPLREHCFGRMRTTSRIADLAKLVPLFSSSIIFAALRLCVRFFGASLREIRSDFAFANPAMNQSQPAGIILTAGYPLLVKPE
jgi:hypothetical protein